jgi:hypothetical protein
MEKKPLNTHCEIRRIRNGKPDWDLVPVEEALGLDRAEVKRCPECWGQVRAEAAGGNTPARYEHLEAHSGCSHSVNFNGTPCPHPNPIT